MTNDGGREALPQIFLCIEFILEVKGLGGNGKLNDASSVFSDAHLHNDPQQDGLYLSLPG